jgi:hypothetical protein
MSDIYNHCLAEYKKSFGKDLENNKFTHKGIIFILELEGYFQAPGYRLEPKFFGKWKLTIHDLEDKTYTNLPSINVALLMID